MNAIVMDDVHLCIIKTLKGQRKLPIFATGLKKLWRFQTICVLSVILSPGRKPVSALTQEFVALAVEEATIERTFGSYRTGSISLEIELSFYYVKNLPKILHYFAYKVRCVQRLKFTDSA